MTTEGVRFQILAAGFVVAERETREEAEEDAGRFNREFGRMGSDLRYYVLEKRPKATPKEATA